MDLAHLALQLLLRQHPEWRGHPVAVVDRDEPQGRILQVEEHARRARVLPGRRYAEGLSLTTDLRAAVVPASTIDEAVAEITEALQRLSPHVEPCPNTDLKNDAHALGTAGVFWIDTQGLEGLFDSPSDWAEAVHETIKALELRASLALSFDRFSSYALARITAPGQSQLLFSTEEAIRCTDQVPLVRLDLDPKLRDALHKLGVDEVGGLRRLPEGGLLSRFGADAANLHQLLSGRKSEPLTPAPFVEPLQTQFEIGPEDRPLPLEPLLLAIEEPLRALLAETAKRGSVLRILHFELRFEQTSLCHPDPFRGSLRPAEPTLAALLLQDLLRRRLESQQFEAPVVGFRLEAEVVSANQKQLELFAEAPGRDLEAANRALARVRASLGENTVVTARLDIGHLPDRAFRFVPLEQLGPADRALLAAEAPSPTLVRRRFDRPRTLTSQRPGPDGWLPAGLEAGPVRRLDGPYLLSGGWWALENPDLPEPERAYHFAHLQHGDRLWLYFDTNRRRWFQQGRIE
ncbi:MAG: DNA polymerase Y family protein [Planctomycetota bacterium]